MTLNREQILQVDDVERALVAVPEWGGDVFVRVMDGRERDLFDLWYVDAKEQGSYAGFRGRIAATTICDENGVLLFKPADIPALELKSSAALQRVYDVAMRINRMTKDDQEALEKNLEATTASGSSSGSP